MIFGDIRRGNQNTGLALQRQFGQRNRACARDNEVSGSHLFGHIVNVLHEPDVLALVKSCLLEHLLCDFVLNGTGRVDMQNFGMLGGVFFHEIQHREVDLFRTHGAAAGEQKMTVLACDAELTSRIVIGDHTGLGAQGIADHHRTFGMLEILFAVLKVDEHTVNGIFQHLDSDAGIRVGLMQCGRNTHQRGSLHNRKTGISARADDDVRLEITDQLFAFGYRGEHHDSSFQILQRQGTAQTADFDVVKRITFLRHELVFNAARGADKRDFGIGFTFTDGIGNGECGIDVTAGTAACH